MSDVAFEHAYAETNQVRLHYVSLGDGEPVVLLHGWPQTSYEWRKLMPLLADRYRLIAPDLRGLGDSSRPATGYDKITVAGDIWALMRDHLGYEGFSVVGHDIGAPVAFRLAADHPDAVRHLVLLDVPVSGDRPTDQTATVMPRWHHLFHNVRDLPEALTAGRERLYLEWFFQHGANVAGSFQEADILVYTRAYEQTGAMRAGFEHYRARSRDADDNRATLASGFRLPMPTLGIGGGGSRGRGELVVESLRRVARHAEGGAMPDCGHFIPEERPAELAEQLRVFLGR